MNPIIESLNRYAAANRWSVGGGPARHLSAGQLEFPVLWHEPLALTGKIGRNEGFLTYKMSFLLLDRGDESESPENIRQRLENQSLGIIRTLENHARVRDVRLIACKPAESSLTRYGETAITVSIEVDIFFHHPITQA